MRNTQKGFAIVPLIVLALLLIGGGIYAYTKSKQVSQPGPGIDIFVSKVDALNTSDVNAFLVKIKNGEKPEPAEVRMWLLKVAAIGFPVDAPGTGMFIVPALMLIDQNYSMYKEEALSIFKDTNASLPLRSAILELVGRHWDDYDSRKALGEVFQRFADNQILQGDISLTLAGHGENIGDLAVQRYPNVSQEAKFYYAQSIATLGRKDAIPILLGDAQQTQNSALRGIVIEALIKLDPSLTQVFDVVMSAVRSAKALPEGEQRTAEDFARESIAMHAVTAIAAASGSQATDRMLAIARDESIAIDVRLTSLEALAPKVGTMNSSEKKNLSDKLGLLSEQVTKSNNLSDKERMNGRITMLQNLLGVK